MTARYAIYYAPAADHPLWRAGSTWLGRDAMTGEALEQPRQPHIAAETFATLTAFPRRYGFHATLRAPFELAEGKTAQALFDAADMMVAEHAPFAIALSPRRVMRFTALTLDAPSPEMERLHAACLHGVDAFRAPLSEQDRERRLAAPLTASQRAHLGRWGYPHVLGDFAFHMTLSGGTDESDGARLLAGAQAWFADALAAPIPVTSISIYAQTDRQSPFLRVHDAGFSGV